MLILVFEDYHYYRWKGTKICASNAKCRCRSTFEDNLIVLKICHFEEHNAGTYHINCDGEAHIATSNGQGQYDDSTSRNIILRMGDIGKIDVVQLSILSIFPIELQELDGNFYILQWYGGKKY